MPDTFENLTQAVSFSLNDILNRLIEFIPSLFAAVVIVFVGWAIAALLQWAIENVLRAAGAEALFKRARVDDALKRADIKQDATSLIGATVKWIILLIAFTSAAEVLGLEQISEFLNQILGYVPNVVASAAILLVGAIFAHFMSRVVRSSVMAAGLSFSDAASALTKYAILVFTILAALVQLGIAAELLSTLFTGLVAMLAIAGGLAFGLGGQNAARDLIDKVKNEVDTENISKK